MSTSVERRREMLRVLELRARGGSLESIAAVTGLSPSTVQRRIRSALEAMGSESSDELRRTAESRFLDVLQRSYALLEDGRLDEKQVPAVLSLIRATTKDLAWLLGSNVPPTVILKNEGIDA